MRRGGCQALTAAFVLVLAACSQNSPLVEESTVVRKSGAAKNGVPVSAPVQAASGQQYTVAKGDTLYSIAFRYGIDFKTLAALNGIRDPYTIYPGQELTIKSRGQPVAAKPRAAPGPVAAVAAAESQAKPAPAPAKNEPATPEPGRTKDAAPAVVAVTSVEGKAVVPAGPVATRLVGGGYWQWPVQGRLLSRFSNAGVGPKGIALGGNPGDPVRAARDGRVVYTGSSLVGYGQLVIVKHDEVYLSAYAHNSKVLVKEGDGVKAGQKIAEMGSTGTDRTKLHFEVRRNGDPVDPMSVLPAI